MTSPIPPSQPNYKRCNHLLHLVLSLITLGVWSWVWLVVGVYVAVSNKSKYERYVDQMNEFRIWQATERLF